MKTDGKTGSASSVGSKNFVFIANSSSDFWKLAVAGTRKAGKELGVAVNVRTLEESSPAAQQRVIEDAMARNVQGLAFSPIDAQGQTELVNSAVTKLKNVITQDSDAPRSNRLCYISTNNYKAGRMAGKLIREALPQGGTFAIFVGRLDAQNAADRRQGICDELAGRNESETAGGGSTDLPEYGSIKLGDYTLLDTKIDLADREVAQQNVADILARYPDVNCLVGLYGYTSPRILAAVRAEKMQGKVKIIGFDMDPATLEGVASGEIYATIAQQPYEIGYRSIKLLNALAGGDASGIPASKFIEVPVKAIKKSEVGEFKKNMEAILAEGAR